MSDQRKVTIISDPADRPVVSQWLETHSQQLTYVSPNDGCGCCVDIFYIIGPANVLSGRPPQLDGGSSDWDRSPDHVRCVEDLRRHEQKRIR